MSKKSKNSKKSAADEAEVQAEQIKEANRVKAEKEAERGTPGLHSEKPRRVLKRRYRKRPKAQAKMKLVEWVVSKLEDKHLGDAALNWLSNNHPSKV